MTGRASVRALRPILGIAAVGVVLAVLAGAAPGQEAILPEGAGPLSHEEAGIAGRLRSALGYLAILGIAFLFSTKRSAVSRRIVGWGVALQLVFGLFVLKTEVGKIFFDFVKDVFIALLAFTQEGAEFVVGVLAFQPGTPGHLGFIFVTQVLPTIIFFASLMTVLYHLGVMQLVVGAIAWVMRFAMRTSGAESLSAAANIFVGQTEAPLLVKPFVSKMTRSELMAIMTGGFATIAGGVMASYIAFLKDSFPDIAGHLLTASVMNAPAGLVLAKILVPETEQPETRGTLKVRVERPDPNVIGAAARGASEGMSLVLNVTAMLLAFVALVYLVNGLLGGIGLGENALQRILGTVFRPLAWLLGVNWTDAHPVGNLIGEKLVLTEFFAYTHLGNGLKSGELVLTDRSVRIASYALLGFANVASIGIQIGGIGGIAPERRGDLARLGVRAMIAGMLAACMSAALAGMIVG